ncbi:hypothetical protein B0H19DRAFT_1250421 [Mycena capillaripes]|nr:hypothetical protein B0H19DRAFT_1250421 [Mycena capillaripes]
MSVVRISTEKSRRYLLAVLAYFRTAKPEPDRLNSAPSEREFSKLTSSSRRLGELVHGFLSSSSIRSDFKHICYHRRPRGPAFPQDEPVDDDALVTVVIEAEDVKPKREKGKVREIAEGDDHRPLVDMLWWRRTHAGLEFCEVFLGPWVAFGFNIDVLPAIFMAEFGALAEAELQLRVSNSV